MLLMMQSLLLLYMKYLNNKTIRYVLGQVPESLSSRGVVYKKCIYVLM